MDYCKMAQIASFKSREFALSKNRDGWLGLFTENAVLQDPVGVSPLDSTGLGHRGRAAIAAFYDTVIASSNMEFEIVHSIPAGNACANLIELKNHLPGNIVIENTMIVIYTADQAGLLTLLQAYWEYSKVEQQLN